MRSGPIVWIPLIVALGIMAFGIWSVFAVEEQRWRDAGRKRSSWVAMMVCFGPLAVLLFFA